MTRSLPDDAKHLAAGFVLGELDPDEEQLFRRLLKNNPALAKEVQALSAVFRVLPQELPKVEPPEALEAKILAAFADEQQTVFQAAPTDASPRRLRLGGTALWKVAAAVVAGLAFLAIAFDNLTLRQQLARSTQQNEENAAAIAELLQRPNARLVALQRPDATPTGTVLFTPGRWDEVVVSLADLPNPQPSQIYRMWLALNDGTVIPCGEFTPDSTGHVFTRLEPLQQPVAPAKATQIFVTAEEKSAPLEPSGEVILTVSL